MEVADSVNRMTELQGDSVSAPWKQALMRTPLTISYYAFASLALVAYLTAANPQEGPVFGRMLSGAMLVALLTFGLLAASRTAWIISLFASSSALLAGVLKLMIGGGFVFLTPFTRISMGGGGLLLLLWPSTRKWIASGHGRKFAADVTIDASAEEIWPFMVEPELEKKWIPGLVHTERLDGGEIPGPGARWQSVLEVKGRRISIASEIIRFEVPRVLGAVSVIPGGEMSSLFRLSDSADGTTTVTCSVSYDVKGIHFLLVPLRRNDLLDQVQNQLKNLKHVVENKEPQPDLLSG